MLAWPHQKVHGCFWRKVLRYIMVQRELLAPSQGLCNRDINRDGGISRIKEDNGAWGVLARKVGMRGSKESG